ncbi:MAG: ATP-binding protein [Gammaproteobacteria bacterium]|nr:MAG: ATP-binding protein [Gammaproteobacteria bacterium]
MSFRKPLTANRLKRVCLQKDFPFASTARLEPLDGILGQARAEEAVQFSISMMSSGYNVYAVGRNGLGKRTMVLSYLARQENRGDMWDWCYVNDFENPRTPRYLRLAPGTAQRFRKDMDALLRRLQKLIPQAFDNDSYYERAEKLKNELADKQEKALKRLARQAEKHGVQLTIQTPGGYRLVALNGEEPHTEESFAALDEEARQAAEANINLMEKKLRAVLRKLSQWEETYTDLHQQLNEEVALGVTRHPIESLKKKYRGSQPLQDWLDAVQADILKNFDVFFEDNEEQAALSQAALDTRLPRRYQVNVLAAQKPDETGVPIVVEDNPNYANLFGYVENVTYKGTVYTDFTLIRPGALHRANGGYLLMDAIKVLEQPFVWDGLKRALRSRKLAVNTLEKELSFSGTISLEPEPLPLDVKIILFGDRDTYLLLREHDPDFGELFKVVADFEDVISRTPEAQTLYARFIAALIKDKGLLPMSREAVMRVVEHSARVAEHQDRLSLHAADIAYLLRESDYWARQAGKKRIEGQFVEKALASAEYRSSRIRDQIYQSIEEGTTILETEGERIGQINALSVLFTGDHEFGMPSKVTATCYHGSGEVIDIERDVKLAGALHAKGMMILSAYLASLLGQDGPIPLSASITFEQSYHPVDGDSATMAECCALISAIAKVPLRQSLAITGSMNQFGEAQPVGGVNEKVEGFFETCRLKGLTGEQGVILPGKNVVNLMLKDEVVDACRAGLFHVYAVDNVLQALELLTGLRAGTPDARGRFGKTTLLGKAQQVVMHHRKLLRQSGS